MKFEEFLFSEFFLNDFQILKRKKSGVVKILFILIVKRFN